MDTNIVVAVVSGVSGILGGTAITKLVSRLWPSPATENSMQLKRIENLHEELTLVWQRMDVSDQIHQKRLEECERHHLECEGRQAVLTQQQAAIWRQLGVKPPLSPD